MLPTTRPTVRLHYARTLSATTEGPGGVALAGCSPLNLIMADQLTRVSTLIRSRSPLVFCPPCIARDLGMTELDVRERLQAMVARSDLQQQFALTRRLCYGCGTMGDLVGLRG